MLQMPNFGKTLYSKLIACLTILVTSIFIIGIIYLVYLDDTIAHITGTGQFFLWSFFIYRQSCLTSMTIVNWTSSFISGHTNHSVTFLINQTYFTYLLNNLALIISLWNFCSTLFFFSEQNFNSAEVHHTESCGWIPKCFASCYLECLFYYR